MLRSLLLRMSRSPRLERYISTRPFARQAVLRFMPGERLEDALDAADRVGRSGIGVVITELGENVASSDEAIDTAAHYESVLERIESSGVDGQVSVKPTHIGLDLGADLARENLERLVLKADALGTVVWVDMEDSSYVDRTLDLVRGAHHLSSHVGVCLQAYLHRTPDDLSALRDEGIRVRLVKGAYREPADVALPRKKDVDRRFHDLAVELFRDPAYVAAAKPVIGTHDQHLLERVRSSARRHGVAPGDFEIHMLYGIRTDLQEEMTTEGEAVRVLISYGEHWYPWYVRRLAERPANLWFVARQLMRR